MFNKIFKLILALITFSLSIWQFIDGNIGNGIMWFLLTGMFVLLYFKNEILLATIFKLKKQDTEGAKNLLSKIKNPEAALVKKQQGYYNLLQGQLIYQESPLQAEKFLKKSLELGLNFNHDTATAKMFLAGIFASKRRINEANKLLKEAEILDKHGMLNEQIKMFKQQMKQVKNAPKQHYGMPTSSRQARRSNRR